MNIQKSIDKTVSYGRIFDYPQSKEEIVRWFISDKPIKAATILKHHFPPLSAIDKSKRVIRHRLSEIKKKSALKIIKKLENFPFVWFIGITGSVAANNAKENDDVDIFIITAPFTLWIVRPFFLIYLDLLGVRRNRSMHSGDAKDLICSNLWLDINNLGSFQKNQNIYTAHEVLQVCSVVNKNHTYERFVQENSWTKKYLATAYQSTLRSLVGAIRESPTATSSVYTYTLYYLLAPLNALFFVLQYVFMIPYNKGEVVGLGKAFFYNPNFQGKVLKKYSQISYNQ